MYTAPIGLGYKYFAMAVSMLLIVPVGLIFFNLISTLKGGALSLRAPLLFAIGALSAISLGLAGELQQSLVARGPALPAAVQLSNVGLSLSSLK